MSKYYLKIKKTFKPGDMIISENTSSDGMFIIESGLVRVFKSIDTPMGSKELELVHLGPKSLFGEMAIIDDQRRSASVQALEETVCMVITKEMFNDSLSKIPKWVTVLIQVLVARLRETNEKLREKAQYFSDDTGKLLYVDENEKSHSRDMKQALEDAMSVLDKKTGKLF